MKRKLLSLLLAAALLAGMLPAAFAGYENFTGTAVYTGSFQDVPADAWYAENVRMAYEYGLFNGRSAESFAPNGNLTVAETIKLAACLHSIYQHGSAVFAPSSPWYAVYMHYAVVNGILTEAPRNSGAAITRAEFAAILARALPEDALPARNTIEQGAIPDVSADASYTDAVYLLYRAGVLTGSDKQGSFRPAGQIKRSEAVAIITRMAVPALRQTFSLTVPVVLNKAQIYDACMPAVCRIYTYNARGSLLGEGSGVLISQDGRAVTCAHVVNGCSRVVAQLPDGSRYEAGLYDMDTDEDLALLQLAGGSFAYLPLGTLPAEGDTVYTLGYPGGVADLTEGKVLDPKNRDYGTTLIESTASARSGNSGGALVDRFGRLVGIVSSSQASGVPSYAVPVQQIGALDDSCATTFAAYTAAHLPQAALCYTGAYPVPDFGKVTGVPLYETARQGRRTVYYYRLADFKGSYADAVQRYWRALNANTFYVFSGESFTSTAGYLHEVKLDQGDLYGYRVIAVSVIRIQETSFGGLPLPHAGSAVCAVGSFGERAADIPKPREIFYAIGF